MRRVEQPVRKAGHLRERRPRIQLSLPSRIRRPTYAGRRMRTGDVISDASIPLALVSSFPSQLLFFIF